ncbi:probable serine/threonine-protein kinase DDB_G0271682 [Eurytemora carolleeae]|uniref:probable serine/threonine-protein kinase DDB_G0271682 n=1 Tax=Eurytemora carolleeae TaxID=1294199 RepID=UPI000C76ACB7|nr:probable serine/threonine-protein kinase DDB_G0271682 [Eurytemora carolleeae]|eukprot:XP_023348643.1 probable serine/threonine-protein kinase DDB_G0271682 [Eurytemora affinis]
MVKGGSQFNQWKEEMQSHPYFFHFPILSKNLRNAQNIADLSTIFLRHTKQLNMADEANSIRTIHPVIGNEPKFIHVPRGKTEIVWDALEKYHPDCKEPVVVLVTVRKDTNSVYQQIMQKMENGGNQRTVIKYSMYNYEKMPQKEKDEQRNNLIQYIKNPKPEGVLITDDATYGGMQARNVIVFHRRVSGAIRNSLLRATTSLIFITSSEREIPPEIRNNYAYENLCKKDLRPNLKDQQTHLEDQKPNLDDQQQNLEDQQPNLEDQQPNLQDQQTHLEDIQTNLEDQQPNLQDQQTHLEDIQTNLEDQQQNLQDQQKHLEDQQLHLDDQQTTLEDPQQHQEDLQTNLEDQQTTNLEDKQTNMEDQQTTNLEVQQTNMEDQQTTNLED